MKQRIALLTALALLLWIGPVNAAEVPTISVETVTAQAGATVDVAIRLEQNPGISSAKLKITYDPVLTLVAVAYGESLGGMTMMPESLGSPVTLNWLNFLGELTEDAVYATLTFTVAAEAPAGSYSIGVSYDANDVYNGATENVSFAVTNGGVTVTAAASAETLPDGEENPNHGDGLFWAAPALAAAGIGLAALYRRRKI